MVLSLNRSANCAMWLPQACVLGSLSFRAALILDESQNLPYLLKLASSIPKNKNTMNFIPKEVTLRVLDYSNLTQVHTRQKLLLSPTIMSL